MQSSQGQNHVSEMVRSISSIEMSVLKCSYVAVDKNASSLAPLDVICSKPYLSIDLY